MRDLMRRLQAALQAERPIVYCRLIETRGSTPQKAGALLLVYPDGAQEGTLGGGCVEAEVKRRALAMLAGGRTEIATFALDSDFGWDDGLICGGRMQVLIAPLVATEERAFYLQLADYVVAGCGVTEAITFAAGGFTAESPGALLFDEHNQPIAALSANRRAELIAEATALKSIALRPRSYAARGVAYLPSLPRCRLVIIGAGHVGKAVADLAVDLEFEVTVVDDRADYVSAERFPRVAARLVGPFAQLLPALEITPDTYVLIVTRGHNHDQEALFHLADRGARYVGLIGSRRKIRLIFEALADAGVSPAALANVFAPVGVEIGSQTVPEIAISIAAELIAHRNRDDVPGRPASVWAEIASPD